ncbi:MAG: NAD-dependent DNA ligase LigA [Lachnospiraceae bacterium]
MSDKIKEMKQLIEKMLPAAKAYYQQGQEIMSNQEYDALYEKLEELESQTGIVLSDSPTGMVGYETLEELPKEPHAVPMLSLDKTKDLAALQSFIGDRQTLLSWKLDGLTIVLTYQNGVLAKAVTRGNGIIGEVVTNNARKFKNLPLKIKYQGTLVLRGEAIICYSDFARINSELGDIEARYKNPRNLCSGSVRQLNNEVTEKRNVRFIAFGIVSAEDMEFANSHYTQLTWLASLGFDVVETVLVTQDTVGEAVAQFEQKITANDMPSDGLVALYDDIAYGTSLGNTAKFPRNSYAFKWQDEMAQTHLLQIEWSPSRTGLINPVAIFEPVELEGTTVSRASVHNVSILKSLALGTGDTITVYKANMIIPQIADNLTRSASIPVLATCPACDSPTLLKQDHDIEVLLCPNPECPAKKIKSFTHFAARNAMNIEGLSEATLEKMIARGMIHEYADLFTLGQHKEAIVAMEGFGEKSFSNLLESIEKARDTTLPRLLYGLGIANVGVSTATMICREFSYDLDKLQAASQEEIAAIDGGGEVIAGSVSHYFKDTHTMEMLQRLLPFLRFTAPKQSAESSFAGKTFVITGSLTTFANRDELRAWIEAKGGKVSSSISAKTAYLVNNDALSASSKNKKAKALGIAVITEEELRTL